GDERAVPPEHPDSNFGMASRTLLARLPIRREQVHRMEAERADLESAADDYAAALRAAAGVAAPAVPRFDLVLLGMGPDGHTASLFPGSPALEERSRLVVPAQSADGHRRLTLTLPVLNAARRVVFAATGEAKADAVRRTLGARGTPAGKVRPADGSLAWILDAPLASAAGVAASSL
ncbi:MAG TPA: 6-phosphogluconolactonase, partial [Planctomycetota bacterium]|nr:6-phosphogluconolactonase [Planctomycetota bacterium]